MKVMVIAAHPDDEVLGCGGALLAHRDRGDQIGWVIVTSVYEKDGFTADRVASRQAEIDRVADHLGCTKTYQMGYSTMQLSSSDLPQMVPELGRVFQEFQPERVYVMNRSDAHSDHGICFRATMACSKSFRYPFLKSILMYECLSETEFGPALAENAFVPNFFIDISAQLTEKLEVMEVYESELGEHPFPRSLDNITALAHLRGATAGVKYAEAFQLLKCVETL